MSEEKFVPVDLNALQGVQHRLLQASNALDANLIGLAVIEIDHLRRTKEDRNGDWMDKWGACKVCGGELPHGHTENCDLWKLEKQIRFEGQKRG